MAALKFVIDETWRGLTLGDPLGGILREIRVLNRGSATYVPPARSILGDAIAGAVLQLRPDSPWAHGRLRDLFSVDLTTTSLGGSVGGALSGTTIMMGAIRYAGLLRVVWCPALPAQFEITLETLSPRGERAPPMERIAEGRELEAVAR